MELTKQQREAFLTKLEDCKQELKLQLELLEYRKTDWTEIEIFLYEQKIKLIEKCLIDNEINL
jgi:hypothetical protein